MSTDAVTTSHFEYAVRCDTGAVSGEILPRLSREDAIDTKAHVEALGTGHLCTVMQHIVTITVTPWEPVSPPAVSSLDTQ